MIKFKTQHIVAATLIALPAFAFAQSSPDKKFIDDAAMGGMTEVALGKLAANNAASPSVKDFGMHMVDDHTKANDELAGIAKSKGVTPPASLDAEHQKVVDRIGKMNGDKFDRAFMAQMVTDHHKTIALFQKESKAGKDADVKGFASKTLPTLNSHLQMAEETNKAAMNSSTKGMAAKAS